MSAKNPAVSNWTLGPMKPTHVCQRCGRGYVWIDPAKTLPVDEYGIYVVIDSVRQMVKCGGRIVPVADTGGGE